MLKHSLIAVSGLTLALGVIATQSHATTTQPEASPVSEEGGIVSVYTVENNRKGQLIRRFVNKSPLAMSYDDGRQNQLSGVTESPKGYEVDTYFVAGQTGEYLFSAQIKFPPTIFFTDPNQWQGENPGWIECRYRFTLASETLFDMEVKSQEQGILARGCGFTKESFSAIHLEAGKHRLRQWIACSGDLDIKNPTMNFIYPAGCLLEGKSLDNPTQHTEDISLLVQVRRPQETEVDHFKPSELVYEKP